MYKTANVARTRTSLSRQLVWHRMCSLLASGCTRYLEGKSPGIFANPIMRHIQTIGAHTAKPRLGQKKLRIHITSLCPGPKKASVSGTFLWALP